MGRSKVDELQSEKNSWIGLDRYKKLSSGYKNIYFD